jgi:hypothetical protein
MLLVLDMCIRLCYNFVLILNRGQAMNELDTFTNDSDQWEDEIFDMIDRAIVTDDNDEQDAILDSVRKRVKSLIRLALKSSG